MLRYVILLVSFVCETFCRDSLNIFNPTNPTTSGRSPNPNLKTLADPANLNTLQLVQIIHRHGDRNRIFKPYPTDPYKHFRIGPKEWGQLTVIGKRQGCELGRYLRARYDGYLSSKYSSKEIYFESSSSDRARMTGLAVLAGLFPHSRRDRNGRLNCPRSSQPIPVHNSSILANISLDDSTCPKYKILRKEFGKSSWFTDFQKKHEAFYGFLDRKTGQTNVGLYLAYAVIDNLVVERSHGLVLPAWASTSKFWTKAREVRLGGQKFTAGASGSLMERLVVGPLVTELLGNMERRINKEPVRKVMGYSGHAETIMPILFGLGFKMAELEFPPYASALLLELHKEYKYEDEESYFVKLYFRNETESGAYELQIPSCGSPCPFEQLKKLTAHLFISPKEFKTKCKG